MNKIKIRGINVASAPTIILIIILATLGWTIYFIVRNVVVEDLARETSQKVSIEDLKTCLSPEGEFSNTSIFTFQEQDKIYICGLLNTEEKVTLSVFWLSLPDENVVYQNPYNEPFDPGYFYSELKLDLSPGHYRVDVYYRRVKLGSVNFTIIGN
jgi:hypothetical protein